MTETPAELFSTAIKLASQGLIPSAISYFIKYLRLDPYNSDALANLGEALRQQREHVKAYHILQKAIAISPENQIALYNLGVLFQERNDLDSAVKLYKKAISINPANKFAIYNLAKCYKDCGELSLSENCYLRLYQSGDRSPDFLWNYSLLKMKLGDYLNGLSLYENRFAMSLPVKLLIDPSIPRLKSIPDDGTDGVLVVSEQGLGDTIQFIRYSKTLLDHGLPVEVCVPDSLLDLFVDSIRDIKFVVSSQVNKSWVNAHPQWKWIPMMSLPHILSIDPVKSSAPSRYLSPNPDLITKWRNIITCDKSIKIGIAWQGNPFTEKSNLRGRSIPLSFFSLLTSIENVKFISLQYGYGLEQLDRCEFLSYFLRCDNSPSFVDRFDDTLAVMSQCDLVLTSDTVVAHLAGAAGLFVYLLLHHNCDWRWGSSSDSTFWYPNIRIFRQNQPGEWGDVFESVKRAIISEAHLSRD